MSNDFFVHSTTLSEHTLARASAINAIASAVEAGFDLLPTEAQMKEDRVTYGTTAGSADVYTVASTYPITAYTEGFHARVKIHAANTGASTINFDGVGAKAIKRVTGDDLEADDLVLNSVADLTYNGTYFVASGLLSDSIAAAASASAAATSATNAATSATNAAASATSAAAALTTHLKLDGSNAMAAALDMDDHQIQNLTSGSGLSHGVAVRQIYNGQFIWGGTSGGSANAQTLTPTPAIAAYAAGMTFRFIAGATNTGLTAMDVSGLGAKDIKDLRGNTLMGGRITAGDVYTIIYDGSSFRCDCAPYIRLADVTSTSGATVDFSGFGLWKGAQRITVLLDGVSGNGTDNLELTIGDTGGLETSGYDVGGLAEINGTDTTLINATPGDAALIAASLSGGSTLSGAIVLTAMDTAGQKWLVEPRVMRGATGIIEIGGTIKSVSSANGLDRVRLQWSGTNNFDAGTVGCIVEF